MKLREVLKDISFELIQGSLDVDIEDIFYDSRKVTLNSAFIALVGVNSDGHDYIDMAIEKGANVIFLERNMEINSDVTVVKLDNTRKALSLLAINFFDNPIEKLVTIAITGTKGKTTTSWMIKNILESSGKKVGIIGTMGVFYGDIYHELVNTTPESYDLNKYLKEMVDNDIQYVVMEISSQALKVGRVEGLYFDYGIFTNLTKDHIGENEHPNMEDYLFSKSLLFKKCKYGIFNFDSKYYESMVNSASCKVYTFGHKRASDLVIENVRLVRDDSFMGISLVTKGIVNEDFMVSIPGEFSAYNAAAAIFVCYLLGINISNIKKTLKIFSVKGRTELIPEFKKFNVIIDYAHNGVSLESILKTMRKYNPKRIIALFGCGGNRSVERRYDMGEISGKLADLTIVTEDNSRNEDVNDIINDIEIGLKRTNGKYIKIADRTEAIKYAIKNARQGDIVLLLGKGHETYQDRGGVRYHYDEREIIKQIISQ